MQVIVLGNRSELMWRQNSGLIFLVLPNKLIIFPIYVRRIDKISIRTNPLSKVVVTDNWIVMVGAWPWSLQLR